MDNEKMWRDEHKHYAHIEPDFHKWKVWMIAERDNPGRMPGAADDLGTGILRTGIVVLSVAIAIIVATVVITGFLLLN